LIAVTRVRSPQRPSAAASLAPKLRCAIRAGQPTTGKRGKPPARRKERTAASPLCSTALAEAEAKAANAEAELLAMLELEEGAAGSAKGKAKGNKGKRG
jgi:hypothetical protein